MMTIDELVENAIGFARQQLIGVPDAELLPVWMIQGPKGATVVGTPFPKGLGGVGKDMIAEAVKQILKAEHATSYSFMSEAWAATESIRNPLNLAPSQREDRREVVIINAFNHNGEGKQVFYDIVRDNDGIVTDLVKERESQWDHNEGRFYNLFDKD